jgi:murein DD-endopeptidase MepM/ murein hydrolase activator NlpD
MIFWKKARKELTRRLTVMLIPHNSLRPLRITFSLSFLLLIIAFWSGFTLWSGYLASRHIDYWRMQADQKLMKIKLVFFAQQMKKSQEMLEHVRENDEQLRTLLDMKSKKTIIENDGKGGPSKDDINDLNLLLSGKIYEMSQEAIQRHAVSLQQEAKERIDSYKEIMQNIQNQRVLYHAMPSIWPCIGHITSTFGFRIHPIYSDNEFHSGLDIANEIGTKVHATADGTVRLSDWQPGYGRLIIIDHSFGYRTYYGHLSKTLVTNGQKVKRGQLIALMGSTGTSTGPHLHYEVQFCGSPVNPVKFLKKIYHPGSQQS